MVDLLVAWQSQTRIAAAGLLPMDHSEGVLAAADVAKRDQSIREFRWTVLPHESRKQRFLWPAVRAHVSDGAALVRELGNRKRTLELGLIKARWTDERSRFFDEQLRRAVAHTHAYLECEADALPSFSTQIPDAVQQRVAQRLAAPHGVRVVQPHPDLPLWVESRAVLPLAVMDWLRDRLSTAPG